MYKDFSISSGNPNDDAWDKIKQQLIDQGNKTPTTEDIKKAFDKLKLQKPSSPLTDNMYPDLQISVKYGANIGCQDNTMPTMKYGANIGCQDNTMPAMKYGANIGCQPDNEPSQARPDKPLKPIKPIKIDPAILQRLKQIKHKNIITIKQGEFTVPKGAGYTAVIKSALVTQGIEPTPENVEKAKAQFEQANPDAVKVYNGIFKKKRGAKFLLSNATVNIPKFNVE